MNAVLKKTVPYAIALAGLSYSAMAQQFTEEALGSGTSRLANQAYDAYDKRDFSDADSKAAMALKLRPDSARLWLLRVYSLQQQGQHDAALAVAEDAVAANKEDSTLIRTRDALRAEKSARASQTLSTTAPAKVRATASVGGATREPTPPVSSASASTPAPTVQAAISPVTASLTADSSTATSRAAAGAMPGPSSAEFGPIAMASESANESRPPQRPVIEAQPSRQVLAWRNADAAYKRYARGDYVNAIKYARRSLQLRSNQPEMQRLIRFANERQRVAAKVETVQAAPVATPPGYEAAAHAYAAWNRQDYSTSAHFGQIAREQAPANAAYRILYINSLTLTDQYAKAHTEFSQLSARSVPDSSLLDAAYTAQRLGKNKKAVQWFSNAIDAADAGRQPIDPVTRENVRQTVSDLDRQWGFSSGLSYGSVGVMNPAFAPSLNRRKTLQSAAELYWRSPWAGDGGGRHLELYVRGNMTHYDGTQGATGISTLQNAAGVRLKPFPKQNVVIAAERLFKVGSDSREDWLLRAAWSGGEGAHLPAGKNASRYWQVYTEVDYFIKHPQLLGTIEARYGRNYRMTSVSPNLSVAPHLTVNGGYDSLLARRSTLGAGAGVNIRYRFRQDKYHAPQSYIDLTVQYRVRVAGDDRSKGIFASLYFAY